MNSLYLSHEFVIQNHADIVVCVAILFVECVAILFVVGLMFQISSPLAPVFMMQHNITANVETMPGVFICSWTFPSTQLV